MSRASIGRMTGRGTVLVVDADHRLVQRVREIVEPHGFDTAWATTVHEAYAHMNLLRPPRLLLVALGFSNLVGWSFLERIQRDPRMSQPPIALATAYPAISAAHQFAGVAYPILLTPIVEDRLIGLVDPAVGRPPSCRIRRGRGSAGFWRRRPGRLVAQAMLRHPSLGRAG